MDIEIEIMKSTDIPVWDAYVQTQPFTTAYHLAGWENVIKKTYGHKTYYLMAIAAGKQTETRSVQNGSAKDHSMMSDQQIGRSIVGILPLIHLKHYLFGNKLISIPFFDMGGIVANNEEAGNALLFKAIELGKKLKVERIELRHVEPLSWMNEDQKPKTQSSKHISTGLEPSDNKWAVHTRSHKVRMLLDLPESSEQLMKSFKSKLRSQIKKPIKEGLSAKTGGTELLKDFYEVFARNMRDLGSPVHSKKLMSSVLEEFPNRSKIVIVYKGNEPLACSMITGFRDTLENPWASSLREYSSFSPNMLLYWTMLEYACENGYARFDFGRSSPSEGTYRFKEQWGARPTPLYWYYVSPNGREIDEEASETSTFNKAVHIWQRLPVSFTRIIGPMIRKHIGL